MSGPAGAAGGQGGEGISKTIITGNPEVLKRQVKQLFSSLTRIDLVRCDPLVVTRRQQQPVLVSADDGGSGRQERFKCDRCPRHYSTKYNLKYHQRFHQDRNIFRCRTCGKRYPSRNSLSYHLKTHLKVKGCKCRHCGKRFVVNSHLKFHVMGVHSGEKEYKLIQESVSTCKDSNRM